MGSVPAGVQLPLQILNLPLICGSEDVDGTTDVAGMTHIEFSGNPRACDNRFRSDQPCQSLLARIAGAQQFHGSEIHPQGIESAREQFTGRGFIVAAHFLA